LETQRVKGCALVIGSPFLNHHHHHHLFKNRPNTNAEKKERREKEKESRRRAILNTLYAPAVPAALELRRAVVVPEVGVAHDFEKKERKKMRDLHFSHRESKDDFKLSSTL